MTKRLRIGLAALIASGVTVACTSRAPVTPTAPVRASSTATPFATATETSTRVPTATRRPTLTPHPTATPTVTPTVEPGKAVFLAHYYSGGDGVHMYYELLRGKYWGSLKQVIYTDGQMLVARDGWYATTQLDQDELCRIDRRLREAGIGQDDPIYNGTPWPEAGFGNGEGSETVTMSGPGGAFDHRFSIVERSYVIESLLAPLTWIDRYAASLPMTPYTTDRVVLWIERLGPVRDPNASNWPDWYGSVSLSDLLGPRRSGTVQIAGADLDVARRLFGEQPSTEVLISDGELFGVVMRPLLPHETRLHLEPDRYTALAELVEPVPMEQLPFTCAP